MVYTELNLFFAFYQVYLIFLFLKDVVLAR